MILFKPQSKVQKDRKVMHETDSRLVKFSGRGLLVNVFTYFLCLSIGDLTSIAPTITIALTTGLIITALIRGFFIARFDQIYATGPSRWRTLFFIATLTGASWWSVILVVSTLTLGMTGETPLLWFYTIIFFATTIHATSPYRVFSQAYLLITLLPPVVAAFYVGGVLGYMYSIMMLIFLGLLLHLVNSLYHGYWERLEANYALRQKTISLEVEKRDIDASVDLNSQFLVNLGHEFRTSLNDILGGLSLLTDSKLDSHQHELLQLAQKAGERQLDLVNNIVDFSRITNRTLVLDHSVFNLRSLLELWITDIAVN
uniref:sensor histidine kinase n=1 Tax=Pseudomaricurvus sp. TaxID=2004510 RepID=UPI003F6C2889